MKCPNCQSENLDNAKFCKNCGQSLPQVPTQPTVESSTETAPVRFCKNCGNPLKPGASFCAECGTAVSDTAKPSDGNTPEPPDIDPSSSTKNSDNDTHKTPLDKLASISNKIKDTLQKKPTVIIIPAVLLGLLLVGIFVFSLKKAGMIKLPFSNKTEDSEEMTAQTDETSKEDAAEKELSTEPEEEVSTEVKETLASISEQVADGESKLNSEDYGGASAVLTEALTAYANLAANGDASADTLNPLADKAFALYTKSILKQVEFWERQSVTAPLYQQIDGALQSAIDFANTLRESNLTITTNELEENYAGFPGRYKENYILTINDLRTGENWSRTTAWQYMQDAASIGLVDKNNPDDALTLRYAYALAWITQKDLSEGINDRSITAQDAISTILSIAENADYNPVLMRDLATYYIAAGDSSRASIMQKACADVYYYLANNENIYINPADLWIPGGRSSNASSTIALNDFWYFNDFGEYSPSHTNGVSAVGRAQIRSIFINALNAL